MVGEQETAADLRRLYTGQAGLWPGAGSGGGGGRQTAGTGGERPQAATKVAWTRCEVIAHAP